MTYAPLQWAYTGPAVAHFITGVRPSELTNSLSDGDLIDFGISAISFFTVFASRFIFQTLVIR